MTLYRVVKTLDFGNHRVERGDFITSSVLPLESIQRLVNIGALSELAAPPLSELPDFPPTALGILSQQGIINADQLMEVNIDEILTRCDVTRETFQGWINLAARWLTVEVSTLHG